MQRMLRESLPKRLQVSELEYEIQRMEVDMQYHRTKSRIFEETLQEQQHHLKQLQESIEKEDSLESE
ncbi:MAG: hypothetical protein ACYDAJ_07900 [Nitrosotalea sp.]